MFGKAGGKYDGGNVETLVGPEAYFHGVLTVRGSLRVEGEVEGNINEAHTVVVAKGGRIQGDVVAENVVVAGAVVGDVVAINQLELSAGGRIVGNIRTPKLNISEGAVFEGNCVMSKQAVEEHPLPDSGAEARDAAAPPSNGDGPVEGSETVEKAAS